MIDFKNPYVIFMCLILLGLISFVGLFLILRKLDIAVTNLNNQTANQCRQSRHTSHNSIKPIIFIKEVYNRSHLRNIRDVIIDMVKHGVSKAKVYKK